MGIRRPYLALVHEDAPQRRHELREVFTALRWLARSGAEWRLPPARLLVLGGGLPADARLAGG
jgi:transposase